MRMNLAHVLFERAVQAQQHSLFDMGKSTFPLSARFPIVLRNSNCIEKMQDWRRDLEGQWNGLSEAEGPVVHLVTKVPILCFAWHKELCKAHPSFQECRNIICLLSLQHHPTTVFDCCFEWGQVFAVFLANLILINYVQILLQNLKLYLSDTSSYIRISQFKNKTVVKEKV